MASAYAPLNISDLSFAVTNWTSAPYPIADSFPLGPGASVTALNSSQSVGGIWNLSEGKWMGTPSGVLPTSTTAVFTLDTGLISNATLTGGVWFWVEFSSYHQGVVGFQLF